MIKPRQTLPPSPSAAADASLPTPRRAKAVQAAATTASEPKGCTNLLLRRLNRRVSRDYDAQVAAAGLKTTQYSLLSFVAAMGPVQPSALAAALDMDASTLTRNLQPLVSAGWLLIGPGDDGRSRRISLTPDGRAKRAEAQRAWKHAQTRLNATLGRERVARLHALVDECLALLDGSADPSFEETAHE